MNPLNCTASNLDGSLEAINLSTFVHQTKPFMLNQQQINQFNDEGYFIVKQHFNVDEFKCIKELSE